MSSTPDPPSMPSGRTFEAVIFDWDGTAVATRKQDATQLRGRVEALCAAGVNVFVVSGTHVGNVDGQLRVRRTLPGRLFLCLNRGSEVFEVERSGPVLRWSRVASRDEDLALDRAASGAARALTEHGLRVEVVSARLNRRKIDLIPEPAWADPPKARFTELLAAVTERVCASGMSGLADVVGRVQQAARAAGLADPRVTSDVKHVEVGLTDKSDSARWAAQWLAQRGVTGGLILVGGDEFGGVGGVPGSDSLLLVPELARAFVVSVGVEPGGVPADVLHLPGGPVRFGDLLEAQIRRRGECRVPDIDEDPAWVIALPEQAELSRSAESLGTLSNGWVGVRGTREEDSVGTLPLFVASGVYTREPVPRLLPGPVWTNLDVRCASDRRLVDLRTGVLLRTGRDGTGLRTLRFVSAARPEVGALRAEAGSTELRPADAFAGPLATPAVERDDRGDDCLARTVDDGGGGIAVALRDRWRVIDEHSSIERIAAWAADPNRAPSWDAAASGLDRAERVGFDRLLADHRAAWAERWNDACVSIAGNVDDELAARLAVFHLLAAAPDQGEAAVGARGLTGTAYGGHVFWDADVFVLPALAAIRPAAARAMLEYRIRRLPVARDHATAHGFRGARFPWESAADGTDATPRSVRDRTGELVTIKTSRYEEHIVADIAWAAAHYASWTGDDGLLTGSGRDLLLDTARYWASRVGVEPDGHAHLRQVMGPDEYHEVVDDNAYTNVMARWNLRAAAGLAERTGGEVAETALWRRLATSLVDGWDPRRHLYEQFAGYWKLEPLLVADVAAPPVAADVLLGPARVTGSQLIKQADVMMLYHLVPGELVTGSLAANLDFYEPRTAHGSSLSPAIHAALLARAGRPDQALTMFRLAARLDIDDTTGTTAGGLHLATMGGVWQALAFGFLGLRAIGNVLSVDPRLPGAWEAVGLDLRFRGQRIEVRADHDRVVVGCRAPLPVRVGEQPIKQCLPPLTEFPFERRTR